MKDSKLLIVEFKPLKTSSLNCKSTTNHNIKLNKHSKGRQNCLWVRCKAYIFVTIIQLMKNAVRVRFAPSPTGPLHIGGVRTALFNYLFAKKYNGTFVLRIEDTDQSRLVYGAEDYIIDSLDWCKIPYDEGPKKEGLFGPYRQSDRQSIYKRHIDELLKKGQAYYAFDTPESLATERKDHEKKGKTFIYNWHNRTKGRLVNSLVLSDKETMQKISNGVPYVIRFMTPQDKTVKLNDLIRGEISIDSNTLDDKILFKSDGMPTYHLANVVDDHLMKISHVIRGEEWLPSLALHQLLYNAFGWEAPQFAHLPLILKPTGKGKLSKRDGDKLGFPVFPLKWTDNGAVSLGYKESGYLPEAVINFLAFLGWNPGTEQEIFDLNELIECFSLEQVNKSGARFDPEKIKWYNQNYLQKVSHTELAKHFILENQQLSKVDLNYVERVVNLVKERASLTSDLWDLSHYFFQAPEQYDHKSLKKAWKEDTSDLLQVFVGSFREMDDSSAEIIKLNIKRWVDDLGVGLGKIMMPLRLALVGALEGVDVFEIIFCIGKKETLQRIQALLDKQHLN